MLLFSTTDCMWYPHDHIYHIQDSMFLVIIVMDYNTQALDMYNWSFSNVLTTIQMFYPTIVIIQFFTCFIVAISRYVCLFEVYLM